ncbi:coproporphyrinogen III oxidase [Alphaproteobacteria bacterium]|nr:coproporphyrinogen III oxidase [Alphaproteobacteria bacterium]
MKPKAIADILDFLQKEYHLDSEAEISMEANPGTFDKQSMKDFRDAGINRLSLGIQSFSDVNLQFLGRIYDSKQAHSAAEIVSNIFDNFSFDFIYGYECQNIDSLEKDLGTAVGFDCKHISCYQLSFDEGTVFHKKLLAGDMHDICETDAIRYYNFIGDYLQDNDIFRYEISNYAKRNFECVHNMSYWKYHDYLGIGPAAHSRLTINGHKNEIIKISDPYAWKKSLEQKSDARESTKILSSREKLEEMLIMGLRLNEGIELKDIHENNSEDVISEILGPEKIRFLINKQLLIEHPTKLQLTEAGLLILDSVVEFLCG